MLTKCLFKLSKRINDYPRPLGEFWVASFVILQCREDLNPPNRYRVRASAIRFVRTEIFVPIENYEPHIFSLNREKTWVGLKSHQKMQGWYIATNSSTSLSKREKIKIASCRQENQPCIINAWFKILVNDMRNNCSGPLEFRHSKACGGKGWVLLRS